MGCCKNRRESLDDIDVSLLDCQSGEDTLTECYKEANDGANHQTMLRDGGECSLGRVEAIGTRDIISLVIEMIMSGVNGGTVLSPSHIISCSWEQIYCAYCG